MLIPILISLLVLLIAFFVNREKADSTQIEETPDEDVIPDLLPKERQYL